MSASVELRDVTKVFGTVTAVSGVSLRVEPGEFLTLLGPSGCGKTTLLRLIAGFEAPTSGSVWVDGADITGLPAYRRPVNQVFQSYALFPHLNVAENVGFGLRMQRVPAVEAAVRVREALALVALTGLDDRRPHELSGGQKQRVALARALVCRPRVVLLDEPLSALDARLRVAMQVELKRLQRHLGITFVLVTHDQDEALALSDRVALVSAGRIEQVGSPQEIYLRPANAFAADFIGHANLLAAELVNRNGPEVTIRVAGEFEWRLPAGRWPERRTAAQLSVRPEKIHLGRTPLAAENVFAATVEQALFKGALERFVLLTAGGLRLQAAAAAGGALRESPRPGDRIWGAVHPDDIVVLD